MIPNAYGGLVRLTWPDGRSIELTTGEISQLFHSDTRRRVWAARTEALLQQLKPFYDLTADLMQPDADEPVQVVEVDT